MAWVGCTAHSSTCWLAPGLDSGGTTPRGWQVGKATTVLWTVDFSYTECSDFEEQISEDTSASVGQGKFGFHFFLRLSFLFFDFSTIVDILYYISFGCTAQWLDIDMT